MRAAAGREIIGAARWRSVTQGRSNVLHVWFESRPGSPTFAANAASIGKPPLIPRRLPAVASAKAGC